MKVTLNGELNKYYVQMLCMIFFPGVKFSDSEDDGLSVTVGIEKSETGVTAKVHLVFDEKVADAEATEEYSPEATEERTLKIAVGAAMLAAGGELLGYRPSWGMLTGVRPSKVAMELLQSGYSKTRVKKILNQKYSVIPKKASLATDVALAESSIIGTPSPLDCSVYISVPFCPSRCAYCSFVSYTSKRLISLIPDYLVKLGDEIDSIFAQIKRLGLNVKTVYIGGGTPTILEPDQLRFLLSKINSNCDVSTLEEFTLESGRPDTVTEEKMAIAVAHGVTRVCINPQTLSDDVLRGIGRNHSSSDFFRAYDIASRSGIKYINTDLIAGLPGDNFKSFSATVDKIISMRPDNITVHTFCVKKASDFLRRNCNVYSLRGGDAGKCVDYSQIRTVAAGYKPYYMYRQKNTVGNLENVGFALEGAEGRYNIYMMEEVHSIFAAGAGAVTKLVRYPESSEEKSVIKRIFNKKYPYEYLEDGGRREIERETDEFYREQFSL
ncbi:MAG: coproporphyrinogen dehydrogenase HemZ [Ruminococcaceae bacterium]|nr:coproporphyrinogen dehydrogenase HemZ [Oscillospiraceae bacterium]